MIFIQKTVTTQRKFYQAKYIGQSEHPNDRYYRADSEESVLHIVEFVTLRIGFFASFAIQQQNLCRMTTIVY